MVTSGWRVHGSVRSAEHAADMPSAVKRVQSGSISGDMDWLSIPPNVDVIVHLAARVHVMHDTVADPLAAFREVNVSGTERLIQMATTAGVKRLIYISSIKVNGEESPTPYSELDTPNPRDAYAVSKWEAEQVLDQSVADKGLEVVIIRPPLVYGPGVKANLFRLISLVNRGIPLPLAGVNNLRSFIYVGNLVDAIETCVSHPEAAGQTYLVNDGTDVSTPELIRRIAKALGKTARLLPCPTNMMRMAAKLIGKSAEMERLLGSLTADTSKIRRQLGWQAPYTMDQGLRETAAWFLKKSAKSANKQV